MSAKSIRITGIVMSVLIVGLLIAGSIGTPIGGSLSSVGHSNVGLGWDHSCAISDGGGLKCWGANWAGQLGDGTTNSINVPTDVAGMTSGVTDVAAGDGSTCAITSGGGLKCWGWNYYGQLGIGSTTSTSTPANVVGLASDVLAVASKFAHYCALMTSGGVKCWGFNEHGQLGDGTTTNSNSPRDVVGLTSGVVSVAVGTQHSCALMEQGSVKCWGYNFAGGLGTGNLTSSSVPVDVIGLNEEAVDIAAGDSHTCALMANGNAKCWGGNFYGQLGNWSTVNSTVPVDAGPSNYIKISLGNDHTCGEHKSGGVVCWGRNSSGQLGRGPGADDIYQRLLKRAGYHVESLHSGRYHSCVTTLDQGLLCWGSGTDGQLGNALSTDSAYPVRVREFDRPSESIAAGALQTCAIREGGILKCWGSNSLNIKVYNSIGPVRAVAAGWDHSCAITKQYGLKCWGSNSQGQLGDGSTIATTEPVEVTGLASDVAQIGLGYQFSCALKFDGSVWCWGNNSSSQLGDGTTTNSNVPTQVSSLPSGIRSIAVGYAHACAITDLGGVMCWSESPLALPQYVYAGEPFSGAAFKVAAGRDFTCTLFENGGLSCRGSGTPGNPSVLDGVRNISVGGSHACAITEKYHAACWGMNSSGQLGIGNFIDQQTPENVHHTYLNLQAITTSLRAHTCSLNRAGNIKCWGNNENGQLGNQTYNNANLPTDFIEFPTPSATPNPTAAITPAPTTEPILESPSQTPQYTPTLPTRQILSAVGVRKGAEIKVSVKTIGIPRGARVYLKLNGSQKALTTKKLKNSGSITLTITTKALKTPRLNVSVGTLSKKVTFPAKH